MESIRNIAIIAHVDHGKTTLVDKIMYHCQLFRDNQNTGDLILDNNDLERERGITITSKNVSVSYKGTKINTEYQHLNYLVMKSIIIRSLMLIAIMYSVNSCSPDSADSTDVGLIHCTFSKAAKLLVIFALAP